MNRHKLREYQDCIREAARNIVEVDMEYRLWGEVTTTLERPLRDCMLDLDVRLAEVWDEREIFSRIN